MIARIRLELGLVRVGLLSDVGDVLAGEHS